MEKQTDKTLNDLTNRFDSLSSQVGFHDENGRPIYNREYYKHMREAVLMEGSEGDRARSEIKERYEREQPIHEEMRILKGQMDALKKEAYCLFFNFRKNCKQQHSPVTSLLSIVCLSLERIRAYT